MSIAARTTLALTLAAVLVAGLAGLRQLAEEERDLRAAERDAAEVLGRALQVAFENALRDRQEEDIEETLRALEPIAPEVDVWVLDASGRVLAASRRNIEHPVVGAPEVAVASFEGGGVDEVLVVRAPLDLARDRDANLLVVTPLDRLRQDLADTRRDLALGLVAFVLVLSTLAYAVSRVYVARPLERLIRSMERVQHGDLTPPSREGFRDDEVGATAAALTRLVADLERARRQLEEETERRGELERGLEEVDKYVTIGRLSAGLAHEIGSPLQVLEGRAAALARKSTDPETQRIAGILVEQAQRITRIVSQLLAVARRRRPRRERVDVTSTVQPIVDLLAHEARRARVEVTLAASPGVGAVVGDPDQLQQIALNLLRNALQASPRSVTIRIGPGTLASDEVAGSRAAVELEVADDGRGMTDEERERAFEPFFTTRADAGGTGLGLAVVRGLVEEHGGVVSLSSIEGEGTRVVVRLPAAEEAT